MSLTPDHDLACVPRDSLQKLLKRIPTCAPLSEEEQAALASLQTVVDNLPPAPIPVQGQDGTTWYTCAWARDLATEPLMREEDRRWTLFPVTKPDIFKLYEELRDKFWFAADIKLTQDIDDYKAMTPSVRKWLDMVLAFFAASDSIVLENLVERVMSAIKAAESKHFYGIQIGNETIHSEMYSVIIEDIIGDQARKAEMFNAVQNSPTIKAKAEWALGFTRDRYNISLGELLIAFGCVEGIMFSSSFACIFNLRERGIMPGLCNANLMISGDEYMHMVNAFLHYEKYIVNKLPAARVLEIVRSAVEVELAFVREALPRPILGMSSKLMSDYVRYVANFAMSHLTGITAPYPENLKCPLAYMENQGREVITNFFERRAVEYQKMAGQRPSAGVRQKLKVNTSVDF